MCLSGHEAVLTITALLLNFCITINYKMYTSVHLVHLHCCCSFPMSSSITNVCPQSLVRGNVVHKEADSGCEVMHVL